MLLGEMLVDTVERFPDNIAVVHGDARVTYSELIERATSLVWVLKDSGIRHGDRVIIALDNSVEYLIAYFGVILAGGVSVAINPDIKAVGLAKIVGDCTPSGIIARSEFFPVIEAGKEIHPFRFVGLTGAKKVEHSSNATVRYLSDCCNDCKEPLMIRNRSNEDLSTIIYTSGTTGDPKGVMLSHENLLSNTASIVTYLELTERDSVMVVLPFYYSYGNSLLLTHVMKGGTLVIDNRFMYPNVVLDGMTRDSITGFSGVPSTYAILMHRSNFRNMTFPSLRYITQAGGPMPHSMALDIMKVVPSAKVYIMYGQTEAAARLSYLPPADLTRKHGSIGKGIPGVTLDVLKEDGKMVTPGETGEIVASGRNIMMGYWGKDEDTHQVLRDGKLFTGDLATVDEEGYIYIVGRGKEMIKSGAHRIAPREIEEVILKHPAVLEAAVVGQPDGILGESICSFVILKDGQSCTSRDLMHFCHENLPLYKMPKIIRFVQSFPKTDSGKIKKEELKKLL